MKNPVSTAQAAADRGSGDPKNHAKSEKNYPRTNTAHTSAFLAKCVKKRLPNDDQMEAQGPNRRSKDLKKNERKKRRKKTPNRANRKTCLGKGTGSALKG